MICEKFAKGRNLALTLKGSHSSATKVMSISSKETYNHFQRSSMTWKPSPIRRSQVRTVVLLTERRSRLGSTISGRLQVITSQYVKRSANANRISPQGSLNWIHIGANLGLDNESQGLVSLVSSEQNRTHIVSQYQLFKSTDGSFIPAQ
eukprot:m.85250 g.85250  ORF g.85250 m.85250 type:complete len:149 (+) comp50864_c0_seq11:1155-1601(+)